MAVRDGADFLADAVGSVLTQTYTDFEFIIVDDGSRDDTHAILERYAAMDPRIRVMRNEESIGLTRSLNFALRHARGTFVARQDADDIAVNDRFAKQVALLHGRGRISVVGSDCVFIDRDGNRATGFRKFFDEDVPRALSRGLNPLFHPSVMFRKDVVESLGGYNESYAFAQDFELWLRLLVSGYEFHNIAEPLIRLRRFSDSDTGTTKAPAIHARMRVPRLKCIVRIQLLYLRYFWRHPGYWRTLIMRSIRVIVPEPLTRILRRFTGGRTAS